MNKSKNEKQKKLVVQFSLRLGILIIALFAVLTIVSFKLVLSRTYNETKALIFSSLPVYTREIDFMDQEFIHELHTYTKAKIVENGTAEEIANWLTTIKNKRDKNFISISFNGNRCTEN